jgi:hypothetical protein
MRADESSPVVSHGSADSDEAEPVTVVADESPAVGVHPAGPGTGNGAGKLTLPPDIPSAVTSRDPHRRLSPRGRTVKRQREIERLLVRARLVAGIAAAEDAKALPLVPRVHGRCEARPARRSPRRASNTTSGSSDSDGGESEPEPGPLDTTPSLAFTGPRGALAARIAAWEAAGGWEVREAPFGLWRVRARHTRRLERLGWLGETDEHGRSGERVS